MTTTFFLVRHAAHDLPGGTLAGRLPGIRLGELGRKQAMRLAERLRRERLSAVHAGPRERTRETAAAIADACGMDGVLVDPELDEVDFGDSWQGRDFATLEQDPAWRRWNAARSLARTPGGERMLDVQGRALGLMERLGAEHGEAAVALSRTPTSSGPWSATRLACRSTPGTASTSRRLDQQHRLGRLGRQGAVPQRGGQLSAAGARRAMTGREIRERIDALRPWFHNMELGGIQTAPDHFLGDYPNIKWKKFASAIPADLTGWSVLDIGCNGGFYSIEMKRRGAERVLGIDVDESYLAQARFAAEVNGLDIEFRTLSVYDVGALAERFDIVLFMGVLYHLRHPLLALDLDPRARRRSTCWCSSRCSGAATELAAGRAGLPVLGCRGVRRARVPEAPLRRASLFQ